MDDFCFGRRRALLLPPPSASLFFFFFFFFPLFFCPCSSCPSIFYLLLSPLPPPERPRKRIERGGAAFVRRLRKSRTRGGWLGWTLLLACPFGSGHGQDLGVVGRFPGRIHTTRVGPNTRVEYMLIMGVGAVALRKLSLARSLTRMTT